MSIRDPETGIAVLARSDVPPQRAPVAADIYEGANHAPSVAVCRAEGTDRFAANADANVPPPAAPTRNLPAMDPVDGIIPVRSGAAFAMEGADRP
ncbi:hypothetical protein [Aliiruegeria haliotis]|uniref:hypothetical protein n=1 Tax=Aliiruegeria haliotis TaxID=1280846 RepID=UPI0011B29200|nr:hypothetical protein [Aliiruegeria haliotis]